MNSILKEPPVGRDGTKRRRRRQVVVLQDCIRPGGTERQSLWLARTLQADEYASTLLLFQPPPRAQADDGAEIRSVRRAAGPLDWAAPGLIRTLRGMRADLVLCMGRNANAYGAWICARLPHARLISTCRTNQPLSFLYRLGVRRSHLCLTNSEWAARRVRDAKLKPPEAIQTIPNALLRPELLDLGRSPAARAAARRQLNLPEGATVLCSVANFVRGKNQQGLIRALPEIRGSTKAFLLLAGDGPERTVCERLAASLGLAEHVRFLGATEELGPVFQASDLFVSAALRDSLPNALVEAQAAGVPTVAYDTAGVGEAFQPNTSGLLVPGGDETALAAAANHLLSSPACLAEYASAARAFARTRFAPDAVAAEYNHLLRELLGLGARD